MLNLVYLIQRLFNVYEALILVWCVTSWFPMRPGGLADDIRGALGMLVEPYLAIFRRFIPPLGGIDFSPVVAILALGIIERVLFSLIL